MDSVTYFTISGVEYICKEKDQKLTNGALTIICPDPVDFCKYLDEECSEDCNANGVCLVNKSC